MVKEFLTPKPVYFFIKDISAELVRHKASFKSECVIECVIHEFQLILVAEKHMHYASQTTHHRVFT